MEDNFEKMFLAVLNGQSVRECEEIYRLDRNKFVEKCKKRFPEGTEQREKLEKVLAHNKSEQNKINVSEERLEEIIGKLFKGNIDEKEAAKLVTDEGIHVQTFREKMIEYVNNSANKTLQRRYIEYENNKTSGYMYINFPALIIEMIRKESSQSQIADTYGIPRRTIGREIEKLDKDEKYGMIYVIAKELSKRKMERENATDKSSVFTEREKAKIDYILQSFGNMPIIVSEFRTEAEEKYTRARSLLKKVKDLGTTQKEAAKILGVSVSTIRRAGKTVEEYGKLLDHDEDDSDSR